MYYFLPNQRYINRPVVAFGFYSINVYLWDGGPDGEWWEVSGCLGNGMVNLNLSAGPGTLEGSSYSGIRSRHLPHVIDE